MQVALDEVTSPNFSPDGQKIIFSGLKKGYSDIYQIDLNGKNLTQLTNDTYDDTYPLFTHDGKEVIYVSEREKIRYLYRLDLATRETSRITISGTEETAPFLNVQGQQLYYIGGDDGIYNVGKLFPGLYVQTGIGSIQYEQIRIGCQGPGHEHLADFSGGQDFKRFFQKISDVRQFNGRRAVPTMSDDFSGTAAPVNAPFHLLAAVIFSILFQNICFQVKSQE